MSANNLSGLKVHGYAPMKNRPRVYIAWQNMIQRCINPNRKDWDRYGGRGINVCNRWSNFENFLSDMGEPGPGETLERIDVNLDYEPNNCKWVTRKEQSRNRRSNLNITFNGKTMTLAEWAEETGIPYQTIKTRYRRGWTTERMMFTPKEKEKRIK